MQPKYHQYDCFEGNEIDLTQANAVLDIEPDVIVLEYPNNNETPETPFNNFPANHKPTAELEKVKAKIQSVAEVHPWAESDIYLFNNISKLWQGGKDVQIYYIDAPTELTSLNVAQPGQHDPKPKPRGEDFCWWAHQCVRAHYMRDNMLYILKKHPGSPVVLSCLQGFHWNHVLYLLDNPALENILLYFFDGFTDVSSDSVSDKISACHPVLQKHWHNKVRY